MATSYLTKSQFQNIDKQRSKDSENVLVAVDRSYSMATKDKQLNGKSRIEAARDAYETLLQATNYNITNYAVMLWNDYADLFTELTGNFDILSCLPPFSVMGGTSMVVPIRYALEQDDIHRIILLSDGETIDRDNVIADAHKCASRGIVIDTIGIGNHDAVLMRSIADITGGFYSAPTTDDELVDSFVRLETTNRLMLEHK